VALLHKQPTANKWMLHRALVGLGNSGNPAAVAEVTPYRNDLDPDVRQAAEQALEKLAAPPGAMTWIFRRGKRFRTFSARLDWE